MMTTAYKAIALSLFVALGTHIYAQDIIIAGELASHSEPLKVKVGTQGFGKIAKWRFGEYTVVDSRNGLTKTSGKTNFWNTKTELTSSHKFSFTLCNGLPDSAYVNAAANFEIRTLQGFQLFEGFTIGEDVLLSEKNDFAATISINSDTSDTWYLLMNSEAGEETMGTEAAVLLGKESEIQIFPASSNKNGTDKRVMPALGYEFYDNDQACAAVQYYGGGLLGSNKYIVWIRNDLDARRQLFLAAAITTIMQHQFDMMAPAD